MAENLIKITPTLKKLLDKLGNDIEDGLEAGMSRALSVAEGFALDEVPVVTSNLFNSITTFVANGGRSGILKATALYALFVHDGTKPHVIKAKGDGFLRFEIGGRTIFRKQVNHPGTKANPFLQKGIDKTDLGGEFERGMGDFLDRRGWAA